MVEGLWSNIHRAFPSDSLGPLRDYIETEG
jgi:hypothetical protein